MGLWLESTQTFGELISLDEYEQHQTSPVVLTIDGQAIDPSASLKDYHFFAKDVMAFLSKFMTLSGGDKLILGPLVSSPLNSKSA